MQFEQGLIWVKVSIPQQQKPLDFLLDTGASVSVINSGTAKKLGLNLGPKVTVKGVRATVTGHWPVTLNAKADDLELPDTYLALDLIKLSRACGQSVDGLIGADFFRGRVVQINFEKKRIQILDEPPMLNGADVLPLETRPCGFRVPVNVNASKSQWFRLDTGCAIGLQWVTKDVPMDRCIGKLAVGLAEVAVPQVKTSVRLGNSQFDDIPTYLHRKSIFPGESGLLGNGLLSRYGAITIDTRSGRLILGGQDPAE